MENKIATFLAKKAGGKTASVTSLIYEAKGEAIQEVVETALGVGDKDEDERKGGIFSFGSDDGEKDEEDKGGLFSFGNDKKKDEGKGGFFSKLFDKEDDEKGKEKKAGFTGLFSEQEGASAAGGSEERGGYQQRNAEVSDGDLFNDLMDVAEETAEGR